MNGVFTQSDGRNDSSVIWRFAHAQRSRELSYRGEILPNILRRPKLRQGVILVILVYHFHRHADLYLLRRAVDDV